VEELLAVADRVEGLTITEGVADEFRWKLLAVADRVEGHTITEGVADEF
jgi:hypothetical protein